jgi:hypothetical protein
MFQERKDRRLPKEVLNIEVKGEETKIKMGTTG